MSSKLTISIVEFKPLRRGSLLGFATINVQQMRMTIRDVTVHESHGKRWASLPSKPQVGRDRELVKDADGKLKYSPVFEFDSRAVSDAFSAAVLAAFYEFQARQGSQAA